MKKIILFTAFCFAIASHAQQQLSAGYDANLAKELQANNDGMRNYVICFLKTGISTKITNKQEIANLKVEHLDFMNKLVESGKAVIAAPLKGNKAGYEEMYLLNASTQEEAEAIIGEDPMVAVKLMVPEFTTMQGSAALPIYKKYHERLINRKR